MSMRTSVEFVPELRVDWAAGTLPPSVHFTPGVKPVVLVSKCVCSYPWWLWRPGGSDAQGHGGAGGRGGKGPPAGGGRPRQGEWPRPRWSPFLPPATPILTPG